MNTVSIHLPANSLKTPVTRLGDALADHLLRRRTRRILGNLDDSVLKDIGLHRQDIFSTVRNGPGTRRRNHDDC